MVATPPSNKTEEGFSSRMFGMRDVGSGIRPGDAVSSTIIVDVGIINSSTSAVEAIGISKSAVSMGMSMTSFGLGERWREVLMEATNVVRMGGGGNKNIHIPS